MSEPLAHVLTLVLEKRDAAQFEAACRIMDGQDLHNLSEDKAADITIEAADAKTAQRERLAQLAKAGIPADICVQRPENRRKTLLMCDMDSTLIGQECIDELADFAGVKDKVSLITEKAMRGEIGFDGALKERVGLLEGLPLSALQTCFETRISLNPGAKTLARTMKANGAVTVIVSGGFTFFTQRVAKLAGFDHHHANRLTEGANTLTGKVSLPILGREAKLARLAEYSQAAGGLQNSVAIGDGANDLAMITAAGLGIAYDAKPAVAAAAHCAINHTDLTSALYFQGYSEDEFVI